MRVRVKDSSGQILAFTSGVFDSEPADGELDVESNLDSPVGHYFDGVSLVPFGPPPSDLAVFDYASKTWAVDVDYAIRSALTRRGALLQASDWTQLPDVPLATKQAWATYRQTLRDVTNQPGYPTEITWPTPPN